jgi:hypothetical protein
MLAPTATDACKSFVGIAAMCFPPTSLCFLPLFASARPFFTYSSFHEGLGAPQPAQNTPTRTWTRHTVWPVVGRRGTGVSALLRSAVLHMYVCERLPGVGETS